MTTSHKFRRQIASGAGERLWQVYDLSLPKELVLEDVALARKVIVTEGRLDKMDARLVRQGNRGLIRVRTSLPEPGRKRFAIAHELGHWELHKNESQLFACTTEDMVASYKKSAQEAEANYFAAGLLMPEFLFTEKAKNGEFRFARLSELTEFFGTSLTATGIRYVDTSEDYVAIVASKNGQVSWWRGSARFEERFWVVAHAQLSPNTLAATLTSGTTRTVGPEEVDIDAWSERGSQSGSDIFVEESLYMARYEQVLTLLRLP